MFPSHEARDSVSDYEGNTTPAARADIARNATSSGQANASVAIIRKILSERGELASWQLECHSRRVCYRTQGVPAKLLYGVTLTHLHMFQSADFLPAPSVSLRSPAAKQWCRDMRESGALLSAILRVAHPDLYDAGRASLARLSTIDGLGDGISEWPTVFNAVQLISNRETPYHRDTSGRAEWYDMLMSLGTYRRAALVLRNLGLQVAYKPGSMALLSGLTVHHGVAEVEPDRLCYAWYMADAVHGNFNIPDVSWMTIDRYGL